MKSDQKPPKGWTKRQWLLACNGVELAVAVERERCAKIAETDEELEGVPPAYVMAEMVRVGPVENARAAVRATKASIARRIRGL